MIDEGIILGLVNRIANLERQIAQHHAHLFKEYESIGAPTIFPVTLTQVDGDAGTSSTQCSFTYLVEDLAGVTLISETSLAGNGNRVVNAAMTAGTRGLAYYDGTTLILFWADERITQTNCPP